MKTDETEPHLLVGIPDSEPVLQPEADLILFRSRYTDFGTFASLITLPPEKPGNAHMFGVE